jgi:CPA2 family monovalent cation:H+ antiporter-2
MAATINIPAYSDALVVLGTAGVIVPLVKRWGLNPVLGYLGAGALLGPLGLGSFVASFPPLYWVTVGDARNVASIADLGVVFLLFLIGLELSYDRLLAMRRLVFGLGGAQIVLSTLAIAAVAMWAGQRGAVAIVIGACLALSSTAIVLEVLSNQRRLTSTTGRASFAILLAQDLAVIPILMLISILGADTGASVGATVARALLEAAVAVTMIVIVGRTLMRPLFRLVAQAQSSELFIAALLFVIVGTGVIAALAGLSMALGAFVAGLLLAETEYRKAIEGTIEPFKGLLLGIFFFTVGMTIDARELMRFPLQLIGGVIGLVAVKAIIAALAARAFRLSWPAAIETALLTGPGGEFAFVGIGLAGTLGLIGPGVVTFTLALTSLTMALIPLLAIAGRHAAARLAAPVELAPELKVQPAAASKHAIVVGYGRVGKVVCALMKEHGVAYTATDSSASLVTEERHAGAEVYYGNAANPDFLKACGVMDAAGVIITVGSRALTDAVVAQVRALRPDILIVARARDAEHAAHLYEIGVSDAVPETIEASLQLSEAALVGLGRPTGLVIASIHEARDVTRHDLQKLALAAGRQTTRGVRGKTLRKK